MPVNDSPRARTGARSISVVVPTFKRPDLLTETLQSLLAQTHTNFMATICDNAADADTEAVVRGLGDDRFMYLPRPENLGMHRNAIDGFRRADGELVMKLDDDDLLAPTCLEKLAAPFDRSDVSLSFSQIELIDINSVHLPVQSEALSRATGRHNLREGFYQPFSHLAARGSIQLCSALIRRDAVDWDNIPEQTATAYDLHIALEAAKGNAAAHYTTQTLTGYRLHPGSDSANKLAAQLTGGVYALEYALSSGKHWDTASIERTLHETQIRRARELMALGETHAAKAALRRAMQLHKSVAPLKLLALAQFPASVQKAVITGKKSRVVDLTRLDAHRSSGSVRTAATAS